MQFVYECVQKLIFQQCRNKYIYFIWTKVYRHSYCCSVLFSGISSWPKKTLRQLLKTVVPQMAKSNSTTTDTTGAAHKGEKKKRWAYWCQTAIGWPMKGSKNHSSCSQQYQPNVTLNQNSPHYLLKQQKKWRFYLMLLKKMACLITIILNLCIYS